MEIIIKEKEKILFEEVRVGEVVYDINETKDYFMKTDEAKIDGDVVNAVRLESGSLVTFSPYDMVVIEDCFLTIGE